MVFIPFLLPPGLMFLILGLGRYEEWLLKQPAPAGPTAQTRKRHLSLVPHTGPRAPAVGNASAPRRGAEAA
ncbi:hypothetical protein ACH4TX_34670 [Streptomyces sp. NPDC021098]|uniref:hypothetical protein n=1 Tax=unclassified Streptomyces TaxID=2593676 RepID=UPI0037BC62AC